MLKKRKHLSLFMKDKNIKMDDLPQLDGLTDAKVRERIQRGQVNAVKESPSRSFADIARANVFTRFNAILGALLVLILLVGSPRDALFGLVLVSNTLIGIIQELRAKWTLDRLYLLTAPKARVIRNGRRFELPAGKVVLDDVLELLAGDQVIADGVVLTSSGLEVDESLLTGESLPVVKKPGHEVLSGSFVVAGAGTFRATQVGQEAYARKLASEARQFKLATSELRSGIDKILAYVTWIMIPVGPLLFFSQLRTDGSFSDAVSATVAGLVGIVPQGLVLLTSIAFAVSVLRLARRNVLVQELPAVEGLARVDVVCVDKTGTLTEPALSFSRLEPLDSEEDLNKALGAFAAFSPSNPTLAAISKAFPPPKGWQINASVPFSSQRKWSAVRFEKKGTWVLGAPEVLLDHTRLDESLQARVASLAQSGFRVLLLSRSEGKITQEVLPKNLKPAALVTLEEKVRPDAAATLKYFYDQGVAIKVISGDNPSTAATVATRAGVLGVGAPIDARNLLEDVQELAPVMEDHTVFGRVTPHQKRLMVAALQAKGHVVAMTGDGVNDVLALKKADIGIAMGSGAPATKAVAQLILLDGRFATLPRVVAEGRQVTANIERVANLFLTKTVYIALLVLAIALVGWQFPLLPRHLTVIDTLTIGIPAFFLSLAPRAPRCRPGFVGRVLRFTLPAGFIAASATFVADLASRLHPGVTLSQSHTIATLTLVFVGLWVLIILARPLTVWHSALIAAMVAGLGILLATPQIRQFFALDLPGWVVLGQTAAVATFAIVLLELGWQLTKRGLVNK
ncbi:MAG: cation-translocating P-type ATPase [Chloroflexi bacterium]|nr:cation-translocating P-type ATPase [Chloroflexota bacterium]